MAAPVPFNFGENFPWSSDRKLPSGNWIHAGPCFLALTVVVYFVMSLGEANRLFPVGGLDEFYFRCLKIKHYLVIEKAVCSTI